MEQSYKSQHVCKNCVFAVSAMFNDFASWAGGKLGGRDAARPPATAADPAAEAYAAAQLHSDAEAGKGVEASFTHTPMCCMRQLAKPYQVGVL